MTNTHALLPNLAEHGYSGPVLTEREGVRVTLLFMQECQRHNTRCDTLVGSRITFEESHWYITEYGPLCIPYLNAVFEIPIEALEALFNTHG